MVLVRHLAILLCLFLIHLFLGMRVIVHLMYVLEFCLLQLFLFALPLGPYLLSPFHEGLVLRQIRLLMTVEAVH